MISEEKASRVLVPLYRSPRIASDLVPPCKFVRVVVGHFLTRVYVDSNDCMMQ